jgi:glutamate-1-semialdehyde 2,1-aminomutase
MIVLVLKYLAAAAVAGFLLHRARRRLQLSLAKHRSLAGHSRMAKRVAGLLPGFSYAEDRFF